MCTCVQVHVHEVLIPFERMHKANEHVESVYARNNVCEYIQCVKVCVRVCVHNIIVRT